MCSPATPVVGNGSEAKPFVVGISTKKLLRQADRDPSSFVLHIDATYKLTQVGYPVVVVGVSDRARRFHLLAIFIVSQQKEPQFTEVLSLLAQIFLTVTGKPLRVRWAMGDADAAQWNALQDVCGGDDTFRFLVFFFHVAKKIYEKTRVLDAGVASMVLRHLHELHFARSEAEFRQQLEEVQEEWLKLPELTSFVSYFNTVWLNEMMWRWQCYHTPSGFAATNNPVETYNASIKRDVTLRRKLKVGALLDRLLMLEQLNAPMPSAQRTSATNITGSSWNKGNTGCRCPLGNSSDVCLFLYFPKWFGAGSESLRGTSSFSTVPFGMSNMFTSTSE
uniref:MULE transposase domain-containing protein n=1 Tax=Phytophthora ramorum TaxID=164328 RepID=H3GH81_PHYRM